MADPRAELEAQIDADPDDLGARAVLGDMLARAGDPRGELVALQLAAQRDATPKLRAAADAYFATHAKTLLGPLVQHAERLTWRSGFIHRVRAAASVRVDVARVVGQVLQHPSGRFVCELALQTGDAAPLVAQLAATPPRALRDLELIARAGTVELAPALTGLPRLASLDVTALAVELGDLDLPALRRLRVAAATLTESCMRAIASAAWPQLERLDVRFGTREDDPATFAGVRPLLLRGDLPALTHLRLRNAPFAGGILRELLSAPLARQLSVVDLSHGSMSPADAAALLAKPTPLAHLRELWLPMRLLRAVDRSALAALGTHVIDDVRAPRDDTEAVLAAR